MRLGVIAVLVSAMALSACGAGRDRDITLRDFRQNRPSPEEFSILPNKELQLPQDLAVLPTPTPGGGNLVDPTPVADAVAILGGDPSRLGQGAVPGGDGALITAAGRFGVDPTIREDLAAADLEFRRRSSIFTWKIVPTDEYQRAYRREALDPYVELNRFRRAGVRTPSAPPSAR